MTETTQTRKSGKAGKIIAAVAVVAILVVAFAFIYSKFSAKPVAGAKAITIEVVDNEQNSTVYELNTDAEFLKGAMEEAQGLTFEGEDSEYGIMVNTVNGVTADYNVDGAYWSFYVNDEYCNYGIDAQPVVDQDVFRIVYEVYAAE